MTPTLPPLNAYPFLYRGQRRDLASVPEENKLIGAWLLLCRDDTSGVWEQRLLPCVGCAERRVPCIDSTLPSGPRECQNCHLNDIACRPNESVYGGETLVDAPLDVPKPQDGEADPRTDPQLSRPDPMPDLLSGGTMEDEWSAPQAEAQYVVAGIPAAQGREDRLRAWIQTSSWPGGSDGASDTLSSSRAAPSDDPPSYTSQVTPSRLQTRVPVHSQSPTRTPAPIHTQSPAYTQATTPPRASDTASGERNTPAPAARNNAGPAKLRPGLSPGRPGAPASPEKRNIGPLPAEDAAYSYSHVQRIVAAARQRHVPHVNLITGDPLERTSLNPHDMNVKVVSPGVLRYARQAEEWLVLVYNRSEGVVFYAHDAAAAQKRADTIMRRAMPFRAAHCAFLGGRKGGVFAATIAVWLSRGWRANFASEFRIDEQRARNEHRSLLNGERPPCTALQVVGPAELQPASYFHARKNL